MDKNHSHKSIYIEALKFGIENLDNGITYIEMVKHLNKKGFKLTGEFWSAIDAVQVAKVNNMYFRDKSKNNISLKIKPYTNILPDNNVGYGLSFAISF